MTLDYKCDIDNMFQYSDVLIIENLRKPTFAMIISI